MAWNLGLNDDLCAFTKTPLTISVPSREYPMQDERYIKTRFVFLCSSKVQLDSRETIIIIILVIPRDRIFIREA